MELAYAKLEEKKGDKGDKDVKEINKRLREIIAQNN
jgi:hypothetical protein